MPPNSPIHFFCAVCGNSLIVAAKFGGSVCECPACERTVPVPGELGGIGAERRWLPVFGPEILSLEVKFVCGGCDRALMVDARREGERVDCPKCGAECRVPAWSGATLRRSEEGALLAPSASKLSQEEIEFLSRK
jgi:DNA-directed RNA polymerase subunit M/transcription elongation factor TFIIS